MIARWRALAIIAFAAATYSTGHGADDAKSFYSGKSLKVIVGLPAGGGADAYARLVQRHLSRHVPGAPAIIVQNMPGAGSLRSVTFIDTGAADDGTVLATFSAGLITEAVTAPERVKVDFRNFAFVGSVSEDIRVCYVRRATGVRDWEDLLRRDQVIFGASAPGAAGTADVAMLRNLFGVKIKQVQGYAGSAAKRLAVEKGEIDGECGGWTSVPEDWLREGKVNMLVRLSPTLVAGLDPAVPFAGDLLKDARDRRLYDFLLAPAKLGRLFLVSSRVPAERLAVLRAAFDAMVADPVFLDEAERLRLLVTPLTGSQIAREVGELYAMPADLVVRARLIAGE
jgi:tripartite-type tricarboxylate transporter receptor subunit TctC